MELRAVLSDQHYRPPDYSLRHRQGLPRLLAAFAASWLSIWLNDLHPPPRPRGRWSFQLLSGRSINSYEGTWVLSDHDSSAAPQTVQIASPVCGIKNFSSVRLYSARRNCIEQLSPSPKYAPGSAHFPVGTYGRRRRATHGPMTSACPTSRRALSARPAATSARRKASAITASRASRGRATYSGGSCSSSGVRASP